MGDMQIYAVIATMEHDDQMVQAQNSLLIRAKDEEEQQTLMREVALAMSADVVKLSNGLYLIITAIR